MSVQPRRVVLVCGVVPAVIVALLSLYRPAFLERLEYSSYDALLRAGTGRRPDHYPQHDAPRRSLHQASVGQSIRTCRPESSDVGRRRTPRR